MELSRAVAEDREGIIGLLRAEKLPVDDLPIDMSAFLVARNAAGLVGAIGMELYGRSALLRSMVVAPTERNKGIADQLVRALESLAAEKDVSNIYLLTETADKYFAKKGYTVVQRDEVPEAVKASSEFSHVCPSTAIVMRKDII